MPSITHPVLSQHLLSCLFQRPARCLSGHTSCATTSCRLGQPGARHNPFRSPPLQAYELRWRMVNPGFLPMRAAQKFMRPVKEMREGFMLSTEGQQGWQQVAGVVTELALKV